MQPFRPVVSEVECSVLRNTKKLVQFGAKSHSPEDLGVLWPGCLSEIVAQENMSSSVHDRRQLGNSARNAHRYRVRVLEVWCFLIARSGRNGRRVDVTDSRLCVWRSISAAAQRQSERRDQEKQRGDNEWNRAFLRVSNE